MAGEHYVYEHVDPRTRKLLYIGMGTGGRAYSYKTRPGGGGGRGGDHAAHLIELVEANFHPTSWVKYVVVGISKEAARKIEAILIQEKSPAYNVQHRAGAKCRKNPRWTPEKVAEAHALRAAGTPYVVIAERFGMNEMSVHMKLKGPEYRRRRYARINGIPEPANDNTPEQLTFAI